MDVGQALRVGVAGHHNVRFFGQQGLEGVKKLLLRALLVGKKLHVVNQQQIERVVALLELVKSLALVGFHHIGDELLGMDVEHLGIGVVGHQLIAHRVHQVGFAQAHTAVNEQRVVQMARHAGHMHGRRARHAVGAAFDPRVERQRCVEAALQRFGGAKLISLGERIDHRGSARHFDFRLAHHGFPYRQRQLDLDGLPRQALHDQRQTMAVLRPDPVHLEAVGNKNSDPVQVFRDLGRQGFDPGLELLLREFLCQLIDTGLPKICAAWFCSGLACGVMSLCHCAVGFCGYLLFLAMPILIYQTVIHTAGLPVIYHHLKSLR